MGLRVDLGEVHLEDGGLASCRPKPARLAGFYDVWGLSAAGF